MMFENLLKAVIGVAVLPVAVAVDIVALPHDAIEDEEFAHRSKAVAKSIAENFNKAVEP